MKNHVHRHQLVFALIVSVVLPLVSLAGERRNCKDLFADEQKKTEKRVYEIAELYLSANLKENEVVKTAGAHLFHTRFQELAARLGIDNARWALRKALTRIKSMTSESHEKDRRKEERRSLDAHNEFNPTLVNTVDGRRWPYRISEDGFLDDAVEFNKHLTANTVLFTLTKKAPYFEVKPLTVPAKLPNSVDGPIVSWEIRQAGSKKIGIGTQNSKGPTESLWIWDVFQGTSAVWKLPMPQTGARNVKTSPNGRYVLTDVFDGRMYRLDLQNGEVKATAPIADRAGAWIRNDGSVIIWTKSAAQIDFDANLVEVSKLPLGRNFPKTILRAEPSPDQKQVLILDDYKLARLADAITGTVTKQMFAGAEDGEVIWKDDHVWMSSRTLLANIPRDLSGGANRKPQENVFYDSEDFLVSNRRFAANLIMRNGKNSSATLTVVDLESAQAKEFHLLGDDAAALGGTSPNSRPVVSDDGRFVALPSRNSSVMIYDLENNYPFGFITPLGKGRLVSPPRWGLDSSTLVLEVGDKTPAERVQTEIWALDGDKI